MGKLDQIRVSAKPGRHRRAKLVSEIGKILPPTTQVRTGDAQAREDAKGTDEFISFLRTSCSPSAIVALFVGAFVIANSLSITIAQRTRESRPCERSAHQAPGAAVLRRRRGVRHGRSFASVVGLFLGESSRLAKGLVLALRCRRVHASQQVGCLFQGPHHRRLAVSLGIIVSADRRAFFPALRATRVPPIAAVREGCLSCHRGRFARVRTPFCRVADSLVGFASPVDRGLFSPPTGRKVLPPPPLGALAGVRRASPCSRPRQSSGLLVGQPRAGPPPDRGVSPARSRATTRAATPSAPLRRRPALMIGLALVTLVATLAARDQRQTFPLAPSTTSSSATTRSPRRTTKLADLRSVAVEAAAHAPGVDVRGQRPHVATARVFGDTHFRHRSSTPWHWKDVDRDGLEARLSGRFLATLGDDGASFDDGYAERPQPVRRLEGARDCSVTGVTKDFYRQGHLRSSDVAARRSGHVTISGQAWDADNPQPKDLYSFLKMQGGGTPDANVAALEKTLEPFPNSKVQTREQFIDNQIRGSGARCLNISSTSSSRYRCS